MTTNDVDEIWEWMKEQKEILDREKTNARAGDAGVISHTESVSAPKRMPEQSDDAFYRPPRWKQEAR